MSREAAALRLELRRLALGYATARDLPVYMSLGRKQPVVLFSSSPDGCGNFLPASFDSLRRDPQALKRTRKRHARLAALPIEFRASACEMDSSNSSDALLMNIFCYPDVGTESLRKLLRLRYWSKPIFGRELCVPGEDPSRPTELDMCFADELLVEAKLTEVDFTSAPERLVRRYRDLDAVFDVARLPRTLGEFDSYQLIRNVLAAHAHGGGSLVIRDRRRPDLLARWQRIQDAIGLQDLASRCFTLTWQDLAAPVPEPLRAFLAEKYGIAP